MKSLIIDAQLAGASGDMFLGAFLDLYGNSKDVKVAVKERQKLLDKISSVIPKAAGLAEKAKITAKLERKNQFCGVTAASVPFDLSNRKMRASMTVARSALASW